MKVVAYYRVSTQKQGNSGLGLEAQKEAVRRYVKDTNSTLVEEYTEIESGRKNDRPRLVEALSTSRVHNATLVVAKLDRLSRDAGFLLTLQKSSVRFVACDLPHANELTIGILAVVAQEEARSISTRTRSAMQTLKAKGIRLGSPKPMTQECMRLGQTEAAKVRRERSQRWISDVAKCVIPTFERLGTLEATAKHLNEIGLPTRRGYHWTATSVRRVVIGAAK